MVRYFTNNFAITNLYKKQSIKSEVVTQMIYGDSFSVTKKNGNWLKIKIKEDGYIGYIQNKNFSFFIRPTHKVSVLKSKIYKNSNQRKKINEISFGSKIKILDNRAKFIKFSLGWISKDDVKPISYKEKNLFYKVLIFKNIKYKWGGKSFRGIDCSGLIQVFLNFNNKYCPRDAKDQFKYFKKNIKLNNIKKNDIIFWKGHVALALSRKKTYPCLRPNEKNCDYGYKRDSKENKKTANLKVIGVKRL